MLDIITYYITFGKIHFVLLFAALLFIYLIWKSLVLGAECFIFKKTERVKALKTVSRVIAVFVISTIAFFLLIGVSLEQIATTHSSESIVETNNLLMSLDRSIFGAYPFAWLQTETNPFKSFFDKLAVVLVNTYASLSLVLAMILVLTLLKNSHLFYKFILSFSASLLISLPIWYLVPAIPPIDGYVDNITGAPLAEDIRASLISYRPNQTLAATFDVFRTIRSEYLSADAFAITTMPSMHVAWATLILYFGISVWAPLALILVPYFILNLVSTVYVAQHYAVDAFGGLAVAILAIILSLFWAKRGVPKIISDLHALIRADMDYGVDYLRSAARNFISSARVLIS